jgi:hypothetical protein
MSAAETALAYLKNVPQGEREDIMYFLQDMDESDPNCVGPSNQYCEYRLYQEYPPDQDDLVENLEKVLTLLCPSLSFNVRWGSYFEIKVRMRWQEGSLQIPLVIENVQQQRIIQRTKLIKREMIEKVLNPERVSMWLEHGDDTLDMMMGVY